MIGDGTNNYKEEKLPTTGAINFYYKKIVHSSFLYRKNNKNDLENCNSRRRNKDPNFT